MTDNIDEKKTQLKHLYEQGILDAAAYRTGPTSFPRSGVGMTAGHSGVSV